MEPYAPVTLLLILLNLFITYRGFRSVEFFSRYAFDMQRIWLYREYDRLVSSGFLHVSWQHLFFNMLTLWFFGRFMEPFLGTLQYLLVYFGSLIGGGLLAILFQGKRSAYLAVGASGAVCGLVFSFITVFPGGTVWFMPAWLYGILFLLYTMYGIYARADNVGHEAHLGGALFGLLMTVVLNFELARYNWVTVTVLFLIAVIFLYISQRHPHLLVTRFLGGYAGGHRTVDDEYHERRLKKEQNLDKILDKIHRRGMGSLSKEEREFLEQHGKR